MHPSDDDDSSGQITTALAEPPGDDAAPSDVPPQAESPRGRTRWMKAVSGIVFPCAATAVVLLALVAHDHRQTDQARQQAISTTREYLVAMATFDYQRLDANMATIAANSTPEFAGKYDEMVKALRDIVVASEGQATATADRIAIEHLDDDAATVIAFVDQNVSNVASPHGNSQRYRMVIDLIRSDGRWVVDNVETV